jgi:nucleotide-binding universal stress UspA family protein
MDIQKLLFATRFDDLWFDALQSLLSLKKVALNHVVLLNVIERQKVAMRRGVGYRKAEEIKLREIANIRFIDWAETLFELGMEVGVYIVVGSLVQQVISAVEKERVDLIVIGKECKSKIGRLFSGSDLAEIIRRANTPVLVYEYLSQNIRKAEKPLKRPLLAMDFSAASMRAIEFLLPIGEIVESVNIINVVSEKSLNSTSAMAVQKSRRESRDQLEKIYDKLMEAGIMARSHVYVGDPLDQIEKAARDCRATMIITGSTGKSRRAGGSLGRVPKGLFEKSVYPVLVIPPE